MSDDHKPPVASTPVGLIGVSDKDASGYDHKADPLDLDALAAVARKATPGPWHIGDANAAEERVYGALWVLSTEHTSIERSDGNPPEEWFAELHVGRREDADLIVAAVNALPALLAALKEARERLDLIAAEYAIYDNARSGQPGLDLNDVARFVNAVRTLTDRSEAP